MKRPKVQCDWIDTAWLCATQCEEQNRIKAIKKYIKHLEKENRQLKKAIKIVSPMTRIGAEIYSQPIKNKKVNSD